MAPPPLASIQDLLFLARYGGVKGTMFGLTEALVYAEQYLGVQGQIGILDRLALEQYGPLQGVPYSP